MAVLLREIGIPSRGVTGYLGGTRSRFSDSRVVRQSDAHAWVEAWLSDPEPGWRTFEPTPPAPREPTSGLLATVRDANDPLAER
jgi:transglutaminase-like putative cysteine protease